MTEDQIETLAIDLLKDVGWDYVHGSALAPDDGLNSLGFEIPARRKDYSEVILTDVLKGSIAKINPTIPYEAQEEAFKKVLRLISPDLISNNEQFHKYLTNGIDVEYRSDGRIKGDKVWLIDFCNIENNHFLAVNQFTIVENNQNKRPDLILFVNGLPLIIFEMKNATDEKATLNKAYTQLQNYKKAIPAIFNYNALLVISDGLEAKAGSLTSKYSRFMTWKSIDGTKDAICTMSQLEVLILGMLNKTTLLDLIRFFTVFEKSKKEDAKTGLTLVETEKKIAAYHQFFAVNKAIETTKQATSELGDGRAGVIWHTQGSGKSLSMVFYTGKLILSTDNPTIVVLTDRNDLDDQLFDTFANCSDLLRQKPVQAESTEHLMELLKVASGGIVFTTIQKFFPERNNGNEGRFPILSERKNVIVIADEAHRSQYGFEAKVRTKEDESYIIYGFAKHLRDALPNASFIGFTGTPIDYTDRNTREVFGDYIDIYDIEQSIIDGATVRIYYESRLAKVAMNEDLKDVVDAEFEEVTESKELTERQKLKSKWARIEAIVGNPKRINSVAKDIVTHFEARETAILGKAMIVCMSRRICVDLYNAIIEIKPEWHNDEDKKGMIKVIMTGSSSDNEAWQKQIRNKEKRKKIGDRLKDPADDLKICIVRDMWLTGFDAPCLHTIYIDKPMKGHTLMQAIARVNRVFSDKPGGLIVDYIGIAQDLKLALSNYTENGGKGKPTFDKEEAISVMLEKYEIVCNLFDGFDFRKFFPASTKEKLTIILEAQEFILQAENGKERLLKHVDELTKAFSLSIPDSRAMDIKDEVGFFQAIKARLIKYTIGEGKRSDDEIETAIKQIVSKAVYSDGVVDVFDAAGIKKPEISIFSDEFLEEIKGMDRKNLAIELLKKLLNDEIKVRAKRNLIQSKKFSEMLSNAVKNYQNNLLTSTEILTELIEMAKDFREATGRGEKLNLTDDELAFYDALEVNDSAVKILGDEILKKIARELVENVRKNTTIDWTIKESVRAKLRVIIKRILRINGYPPDKQEKAVLTVLQQAEMLAEDWVSYN
jgi:type I restriction enzyme R subunit